MAFGFGSADEIAEPDSDDPKEVFAFFGLAAYAAQVLEAELVNLIAATHLIERVPESADDLEALFAEHFSLTLGRLVRIASTRAKLPPDAESIIGRALAERNRLTHRFFGDHSENFLSAVGRQQMLTELRDMTVVFRRADAASEHVSSQLFASLGITPAVVGREIAKMRRTARDRDHAI